MSKVIPIYRGGIIIPDNFRPISLDTILLKIIDNELKIEINDHFELNIEYFILVFVVINLHLQQQCMYLKK